MHTTPVSLLQRLRRRGERDAWERFVELYTPLLYHWAHGVGLQDSDAADLVQDVFTILIQKLPDFSYQPDKSFRAWLRTVTFNRWRDLCKKRGRQPQAGQAPVDVAGPDALAALWEDEYRRQLVGRALELMKMEFQPTTWQACCEFVLNERPALDIAAQLGISENAVYIAKSRVLRRLRQELAGLLE